MAHQKLVALSFLGDASMVIFSLLGAYLIRFETRMRGVGVLDHAIGLRDYAGHVLLGAVLMIFLLANFRAHDPRNFLNFRRTLLVVFKSVALWFGLFLSLALLLKIDPPISRIYCMVGAGMAWLSLSLWRWVLYCLLRREPIASALRQKVVFVGWNDDCEVTARRFADGRAHAFQVLGRIVTGEDASLPSDVPVLGSIDDARHVLRESGADVVMAVDGALDRAQMIELAETCGKEFLDFKLVPSCFQVLVSGLQLETVHGVPVLGVGQLPLHHAMNNALKRAVDIVGALVGLALSAPVMAAFAAMVYFESRGPVIYRQRRIGLNGMPFEILKIRSMKLDAESTGAPGWTVANDPRRLKVGAFMRAWNIDELPQFWNVLRGEMSLVGPRPERPELIEGFKEDIRYYNVRHNVKPGVTGWAQVNGLRGDTCLRERVKFDLDYIENWNLWLDVQIMALTFFKRKGAC
ncbi:exopolysaccharide biosynthesis polyprenyl glycosylphosphotransferase [Haloferula luteola]|uniref:Exopolysaccharide biosynthesis polyprenyl glycosylphosphotransferase n=1 Tax=Haloferula luteola TaxID=595692 RepID=A0A840V389_9BACT|nr:sugar transferase [Haloferula luteola]MBB5351506.1 exopolysaccharide biosynthesis polyprenyl glycosylphosphotransferase [Haloferula luteola]